MAGLAFLQRNTDGTDTANPSIAGVNIGSANADRYVIVGICARKLGGGSATLNSATIGGISATIIAQGEADGNQLAWIGANVPTGTTATIATSWSQTMTDVGFATYTCDGILSLTAYDSSFSSATPPSYAIDCPAGGIILGISYNRNGSASCTWVGITEDYDDVDFAGNDWGGAHDTFASAQTNLTVSATWVTSSLPKMLVISLSVGTPVTVTPSTQVVTSSVPARTISTGTKSSPSAQVSTFSVPAYSVKIAEILTPSAQVATFNIPVYTLDVGNVSLVPNAQVATFSVPAYSVLYGVTLSPNAQVDTFSIPAYTVAISEVLAVSAQGLLFSIPVYSILLGIKVSPSAQVATFSIPAYTQTAETRVSPAVKTATFSIPAYSLALDMVLGVSVQTLTFSLPTLYNFGAVWEKVPRSTNSTWSRTSRNST